MSLVYRVCHWLAQGAVGFYFSRIERFHGERVPLSGPLLFTSNHPNSLTDAFVIGTSVARKVNFVGTVQLFNYRPARWLLRHCGVIAVNRMKDDPRAMRTVLDTFESCFRVLEQGEAVAIFPEGVTHDDPQLKTVKTGAARMALELEQRHAGTLGLQILPVGLTFSAKELYRSEVLVNFGAPLRVADWIKDYADNRHECIRQLTTEIEQRIEALILHLRRLERARLIQAVKRLYLDRLLVANRVIHEPVPPQVGELLLTQAIARAVDFTCEHHPEVAERFTQKLAHFEHCLGRLHISDEDLAHFPGHRRLFARCLLWLGLGLVLLPVTAYGWIHRWLPILALDRIIQRVAGLSHGNQTHVSTAAMLGGTLCFGLCYAAYFSVVYHFFGLRVGLWYLLSLPVTGLVAHWYAGRIRRFIASLRCAYVLFRAPSAGRHLLALRNELSAEIESARWQVPAEALT